jgi:hypothetical protein
MKVICLSEEAFYELLDIVLLHMKEKEAVASSSKWISDIEVMELLGITSKTTLQKLRDSGEIEYTQPMKKVIKYNRESVLLYLEKYKRKTF